MAGDPSQVLSYRSASAGSRGGRERHPIRTLSPRMVCGGKSALLPMKVRLPMEFGPRIIKPSCTRGAPKDTLSAMKLSPPMDNRSGEIKEAVEISAPEPSLAPSSLYHGAR